jgi:thiol:disulfide interchange protein DsbD
MSVPAGWHTYWRNPGETGMAPEFRWTLPDGVRPVAIHFPVPRRFEDSGIVSIGYEHAVRLLAEFEAESTLSAASVDVGVAADWMVCRDLCLPVASTARVTLPVVAAAPDAAGIADRFSGERATLPRPAEGWQVSVERAGDALRVRLVPAATDAVAGESWARAHLFPVRRGALDLAAPPVWTRDGDAWKAVMKPGPEAPAAGDDFEAVLAFEESGKGWLVGAEVVAP